jgi:hypothetical protein
MKASKSLLTPFIGNRPNFLAWAVLAWVLLQALLLGPLLSGELPSHSLLKSEVASVFIAVEIAIVVKTLIIVRRIGVGVLYLLLMLGVGLTGILFAGVVMYYTNKLPLLSCVILLPLVMGIAYLWNKVLDENSAPN